MKILFNLFFQPFLFLLFAISNICGNPCDEAIRTIREESVRPSKPGVFNPIFRKFLNVSKVRDQISKIQKEKQSFLDVHRELGERLAAMKDQALPYIPFFIEQSLISGLMPTASSYFLIKMSEASERSKDLIFSELLRKSIDPAGSINQREAAQMILMRFRKDEEAVKTQRVLELLDKLDLPIVDRTNNAEMNIKLGIAQTITKFCLPHIEDAVKSDEALIPRGSFGPDSPTPDVWYRFFELGFPAMGIPLSLRTKVIQTLESVLMDSIVGGEAAIALSFLAADPHYNYYPSQHRARLIQERLKENFGSSNSWTRYYSEIAAGVTYGKDGFSSPHDFLLDLAIDPQSNTKQISRALVLLDAVLSKYIRTPGNKDQFTERLDLALKRGDHLKAADINPEVENAIRSLKAVKESALKQREIENNWLRSLSKPTSDVIPFIGKPVKLISKTKIIGAKGNAIEGILNIERGLLGRGVSVSIRATGEYEGNIYNFSIEDIQSLEHNGAVIFRH